MQYELPQFFLKNVIVGHFWIVSFLCLKVYVPFMSEKRLDTYVPPDTEDESSNQESPCLTPESMENFIYSSSVIINKILKYVYKYFTKI